MSIAASVVAPVLAGGGSATVITTGIGTIVVRVLKRVATDVVRDANKDIQDEVTGLKIEFAKQTGGNSNGLRQAIDQIDANLGEVKEDVAYLKGALGVEPRPRPRPHA